MPVSCIFFIQTLKFTLNNLKIARKLQDFIHFKCLMISLLKGSKNQINNLFSIKDATKILENKFIPNKSLINLTNFVSLLHKGQYYNHFLMSISTQLRCLIILSTCFMAFSCFAQITTVGSGSYTNTFPGTDAAGRNAFPSGSPQVSGNAIGKPIPTNDWWSKLVKENHADNLFNYPMTLKTTNQGLIVSYIPWGVIGDSAPIELIMNIKISPDIRNLQQDKSDFRPLTTKCSDF